MVIMYVGIGEAGRKKGAYRMGDATEKKNNRIVEKRKEVAHGKKKRTKSERVVVGFDLIVDIPGQFCNALTPLFVILAHKTGSKTHKS